jgi:DNA-binding transcriptional regulator GbsR (MarR family)
VHVLGDRRDHFESLKDPWEMLRQVLDERKRREIDPTIDLLRECLAEAERAGSAENTTRARLADLLQFFSTMTGWYDEMRRLPRPLMVQFVKLGGKVRKFLGRGS